MACNTFENLIPEYLENHLPVAQRSGVEAHLAGCGQCEALARQLEKLDRDLVRAVKTPVLSPEFKAKVEHRIQSTVVWSAAERAERRRRLQAEYEAGLARLRPFPMPPRGVLNGLGFAALFALASWLAVQLLPQTVDVLAGLGLNGINQNLASSLVASAIFVGFGLLVTFPRQFKRLLHAG